MSDAVLQMLGSVGYIFVMIIMAYIFKKYPPKKINHFYGYRTRRSMSNQKIWDAANGYWLQQFIKLQWVTLGFPFLLYFLFPAYNFITTVLAHTLVILATIPITEVYLDKHFDKNGNPK